MRLWDEIKWIFTDKKILPKECYYTPSYWGYLELARAMKRRARLLQLSPRGPRGSSENYERVRQALVTYAMLGRMMNGHRLQDLS